MEIYRIAFIGHREIYGHYRLEDEIEQIVRDNLYERVRSKIVVKLKINEFLDHCKERRRMRQDNN